MDLRVFLNCPDELRPRVKYVIDTFAMVWDTVPRYEFGIADSRDSLIYSIDPTTTTQANGRLVLRCRPSTWRELQDSPDERLLQMLAESIRQHGSGESVAVVQDDKIDWIAVAFYFLASLDERRSGSIHSTRGSFGASVYSRCQVPQDIVDRLFARLTEALTNKRLIRDASNRKDRVWPDGAKYVVVLSHDVDFVPERPFDSTVQFAKTIARHLIRERSVTEAWRATTGLIDTLATGGDPYGCIPRILEREIRLGVKSSFQVAVGHRHPNDVNYHVESDKTRDYLKRIVDSGFDLCLHGSYRATENPRWFREEVELLTARLARPCGSRQHFLSFDYDALFRCLEDSRIAYDMSMGYPDRTGPRNGFSYPYFPYCMEEERPYDVVEIGLGIMDVTLRHYMMMKDAEAWRHIQSELTSLGSKGACTSVVWHPILFGNARDPGYAHLYWKLIEHVRQSEGLATDGGTINDWWRMRARRYESFRKLSLSGNHAVRMSTLAVPEA